MTKIERHARNAEIAARYAAGATVSAPDTRNARSEARANARQAVPRTLKMIEMYRQGLTLEKIGSRYGITRERVRQVLAKAGVKAIDGGQAVATRMRGNPRATMQAQRDARYQARHGMTYSVYIAHPLPLRLAFRSHENSSKGRGIPFLLTFAQWLAVWKSSGKLAERGIGKDKFCMSRICDTGGYEIGNVHIQLCTENSSEAVNKWRGKVKKNPGVFLLYPGLARPYLVKHQGKNLGFFATEAEAVAAKQQAIELHGPVRSALGSGRGWTQRKGCKTRPYQVICVGKRGYFATQAEAEAAYRQIVAEARAAVHGTHSATQAAAATSTAALLPTQASSSATTR